MKPKLSDTDHSLKKVRGPYNSKGKDKTKQLVTEETARIVETLYSRRPDMVFTCLKCEYTSTQRGHLREHVEKHIEGLKYTCSFCNKKSSTSQSLRGHMQKYHWSRSKKKKHGDNYISATTVHSRRYYNCILSVTEELHPQCYWGVASSVLLRSDLKYIFFEIWRASQTLGLPCLPLYCQTKMSYEGTC